MSKEHEALFSNLSSGYEGAAEFYDLFADNSDIPFYIKYAKRTGSPILDIAAGTGRIAIALAREGFDVTGLDSSPSMLATAREKLHQVPEEVCKRITLIEGNMERFKIPKKFALIIIPNSFEHALTRDAQLATLHCIKLHLRHEGLFILDLSIDELQYANAKFEDIPKLISEGRTIVRRGNINLDRNRKLIRMDLQYIIKNVDSSIIKTVEVSSGAALISNMEIDSILLQSGFEVVEEVGGFDESPYNSESNRRVIILKKSESKR